MGDFSDNYSTSKKAFVQISQGNKKVEFKPFLKDFSYEISVAYSNEMTNVFDDEPITNTFNFSKYSFTLDINSANVDESIRNHKKFQILARMVVPNKDEVSVLKTVFIKFANLISSDGGMGINNISSSTLKTKGFEGLIKNIEYSPDVEMGFFFHKGRMFAKNFSLKLEATTVGTEDATAPQLFKSGFNY